MSCPRIQHSRLEPGPLGPESSALTVRPPRQLPPASIGFKRYGISFLSVVNDRRALPPPEISSKVSEERNILEEQRVSDPAITRRWSYCKIAMGCGVAAIGLYAAYKYFR